MEFAGHEFVVISPQLVACPSKKVKVHVPLLRKFMETGEKMIVGFSEDSSLPMDERQLKAWYSGDGYIHIGCLREVEDNAKKIYFELLKCLISKSV